MRHISQTRRSTKDHPTRPQRLHLDDDLDEFEDEDEDEEDHDEDEDEDEDEEEEETWQVSG